MKKLFAFALALIILFGFCFSAYAGEETAELEPDVPENKTVYYGDVNGDYKVTAVDARIVLRFSAQLEQLSGYQARLADCDLNKYVSAVDARYILRMAAGLEKLREFDMTPDENDETMYSVYDFRKKFYPTLSGFETNIAGAYDDAVVDSLTALENYCRELGAHASVYYTDVKGKYYIKYNGNTVYRTQCTIKAPYVKSALEYMEKNNIPLSRTLTLKSSQKWRGHPLSNYPAGTKFTIETLINYAIRESDNTAYQMLFDYFGSGVFNQSSAKAGSSLRLNSYIFGQNSPEDMAKLYLDIYRYNGKYREFLLNEMENASLREMICSGVPEGIRSVHKWGTGGPSTVGLHDCAIIFTDTPCVLIIYTDFNFTRDYDAGPFGVIASYIVDINRNMPY